LSGELNKIDNEVILNPIIIDKNVIRSEYLLNETSKSQ
jgi:hypothetical protein